MKKVEDLFEVRYGVNLELNSLEKSPDGVNFVSRTAKNNGVAARVVPVNGINPLPAGTITVAGGGSVMESFLQPEPYYSGRDLYYLVPREELTETQKLYYCACLRANKYRYSYGRQANRTLKNILIPSPNDIPSWVNDEAVMIYEGKNSSATDSLRPILSSVEWKRFRMSDLFELKKGKRLTKADMIPGEVPFIGATDSNNGLTNFIAQTPLHPGNTMTVNYNGNGVAETYYQPKPYRCSDDVNVLYPKFQLNQLRAMFIATVIQREKYRFSYGRKWHLERMSQAEIHLPVTSESEPDWEFMEIYIKTLPFSSQLI